MRCTLGQFGFTWGPLQVERTATLPGGRVVLTLRTDAGRKLEVFCSRTGRSLRVYDSSGNELTGGYS